MATKPIVYKPDYPVGRDYAEYFFEVEIPTADMALGWKSLILYGTLPKALIRETTFSIQVCKLSIFIHRTYLYLYHAIHLHALWHS